MNRFKLFQLLRKNNNIAFRRSPAFEQSMVAKVLMGIGGAMFVIYLIIYGTMFASIANSDQTPALICGLLPFLLVIDFGIRFMVQQTPVMLMKPYVLLPIPRRSVIDTFMLSSLGSVYNWLWLSFFIPYVVIVLAGGCEWWLALSILISGMLMIMLNSQIYLMVRTLVSRSLLWWILPILLYGGYFLPLAIDTKGDLFGKLADGLVYCGEQVWMPFALLVLLCCMWFVNRKMQFAFVYEEISRQEKAPTQIKHLSQFSFLERFGESGEYLKLELKSIFRNKAIRARFISSISLMVVLSALITYTDVYDGRMLLNFWCYYCFMIYGVTSLVKVMGPEGNYIDLLMTQHENILKLLFAKYYFHCAILILPLLIMLPAVFEGKFTMMMMIAYMLLTSGLLYFIMFQLAIYNKQTLPLDQKLTGKAQVENGLQLVLELVAMFLPILVVAILLILFDETTSYVILSVIGFLFTITHPIWLRNVYTRLMKRKYENLEGFHASRS